MTVRASDDKIITEAQKKFPNDYWSQKDYYQEKTKKESAIDPNSTEETCRTGLS